jgi:hypothetical protein
MRQATSPALEEIKHNDATFAARTARTAIVSVG